ncbi:protein of unknown function [Granulicella rosea]|uniref:DUF3861 domain-containing protein n=1 Tax=Granulicella rosea TaxID=474952 RepID=A0A239LRA0_9BACT|nr:DUF3861 domain-containing protein [Granulicella rosea]SNT32991.1 protein of unknown function [Granulicella rosea]
MGIYKYKVTVEDLGERKVDPDVHAPLVFYPENHDNILNIAERQASRWPAFTADEAASLAIGLKLFAEVGLKHRNDPLFAPLMPHLREFIGRLKQGPATSSSQALGPDDVLAVEAKP